MEPGGGLLSRNKHGFTTPFLNMIGAVIGRLPRLLPPPAPLSAAGCEKPRDCRASETSTLPGLDSNQQPSG